MDLGHDRTDKRLGALYLALLDVVGHGHEPSGLTILFDEDKGELLLLEPRPLRGEFEEYGVEAELELVLPLLDLLIRRTGLRERIEPSARLIVGNDELLIVHHLDAIDLSGELDTIEEYPSEGGTEIVFEMQIPIRLSGDFGIERTEILSPPIEEIALGVLAEPFLFEGGLEGGEKGGFRVESGFFVVGEKYFQRLVHRGSIARGFAFGLRKPQDIVRDEVFGTAVRDIQEVLERGHRHGELLRNAVRKEVPLLSVVREREEILAVFFEKVHERFGPDGTACPCGVEIGETSERSIGLLVQVHARVREHEVLLGTGEYRVDETADILVVILLGREREVLRERRTGDLPELVLLLGEPDSIHPPVFKPLRLVDGYEVHGGSFVPHQVRRGDLHIVLLHERDELPIVEDGQESGSFLERTHGLDELADIREMAGIETDTSSPRPFSF